MNRWSVSVLSTVVACAAALWLGREQQAAHADASRLPAAPAAIVESSKSLPAAPGSVKSPVPIALPANLPPLPAADVALAQAYDDLAARARAGDAVAAQRLARGLSHCRHEQRWRSIIATAAARTVLDQPVPDADNTDELVKADRKLDLAQRVMKLAQSPEKECTGLNGRQLDESYTWQQRAAELDADDARLCLLDRADIDPVHYATEVEHLRSYRDLAPRYVDERLRAGDWGVVVALAQASSVRLSGMTQLSLLYDTNDAAEYRYLSLLRLGGQSDPDLDAELARIEASLDPSARNDAEAWARDMRANHFQRAPSEPRRLQAPVCGDSGN